MQGVDFPPNALSLRSHSNLCGFDAGEGGHGSSGGKAKEKLPLVPATSSRLQRALFHVMTQASDSCVRYSPDVSIIIRSLNVGERPLRPWGARARALGPGPHFCDVRICQDDAKDDTSNIDVLN